MIEGGAAPKIEKKKAVEPKFLLNRFNGLFKSNKEVTENLTKGAIEVLECDSQVLRKEELRLYKELTSNVLGEDFSVNPEEDPFFKVAKVPIEKVYIEKHDIMEAKERDPILMPTVMLLSGDYFLEPDTLEGVQEGNKVHFNDRVNGIKKLENGKEIDFQLFDPIKMNTERDWVMQFGFTSFGSTNHKGVMKMIGEGTVILEPGVVDSIRGSKESENISKKLQEILTWFNHDLTAHGTLLTGMDIDREILQAGDSSGIINIFDNRRIMQDNAFSSAFAGELWSLNLHQSIFQEIVNKRPAVIRYLRGHLDNYVRSVESAIVDISDKKLAHDVKDYLLKAYSFGFFRLVNPKDFHQKPEFESLRNKYPTLDNLGVEEAKVREFAFGEKGLVYVEGDKKSFIPHSAVFDEFVGSFEAAKRLQLLIKNLGVSLKGDPSTLLQSERDYLRNVLKQYHYFEIVKMLQNFRVNIGNFKNGTTSLYGYFNKDLKSVVDVIVDPETTTQNFAEKVTQKLGGGY